MWYDKLKMRKIPLKNKLKVIDMVRFNYELLQN